MDTIMFRLLGGFHLYISGDCADAPLTRSPKGTLLLIRLLVACGETVTVDELIQILALNNPGALKTLVSRTRALLAELHPALGSLIATAPGGYRWQASEQVEVDFLRFEQLCAELHACHELTPVNRACFDAALTLYQGDLLTDWPQRSWAVGRAMSLQALYLATVQRYLTMLQGADEQEEMLRVCRSAMVLLPFNEGLRLRLSQIMARTGSDTASRHLEADLRRSGTSLDEGLLRLRSELSAAGSQKALVCDNAMFSEICSLVIRNLARSGSPIGLGLMRIRSADGQALHPVALDMAVDSLTRRMADSLRRGDVICRVAEDRVAVLLPSADQKVSQLILERQIRGFFSDHSPDECLITYRTTEL